MEQRIIPVEAQIPFLRTKGGEVTINLRHCVPDIYEGSWEIALHQAVWKIVENIGPGIYFVLTDFCKNLQDYLSDPEEPSSSIVEENRITLATISFIGFRNFVQVKGAFIPELKWTPVTHPNNNFKVTLKYQRLSLSAAVKGKENTESTNMCFLQFLLRKVA